MTDQRMTRYGFALSSLLIALCAIVLATPASAVDDQHIDQFGPVDMVEMVFFPFVPNGAAIGDSGPWHGSLTVQNLESRDVRIWAFTDAGFNPDGALGTYLLPPQGSITIPVDSLGLETDGSPIVIAGMFRAIWDSKPEDLEHVLHSICGPPPGSISEFDVWRYSCKPVISGVARIASPEPLSGASQNRTNAHHVSVDGYNGIPAQDVSWGSQSAFCDAVVARWPDDCSSVGTYEPLGYGVGFVFDGHSYLPIVQTNSGWNTVIQISNIDPSVWAGQVNVTLIPSSQQQASGSAREISFERILRPGESWALDLRESGVPDGWVGSAHITSNVGVVTYAARFKADDDMLMINVAAPSVWSTTSPGAGNRLEHDSAEYAQFGSGPFEKFAPLVFRDYYGWNTGISIVNIDEATNRVFVTWYDANGQMRGTDIRTIPAQGQDYIYLPGLDGASTSDGRGWVGSITLSSDRPFHATVDQVKYETGEAMSYMATAAGASAHESSGAGAVSSNTLSLPLIQKGVQGGLGDTSGIQLFNPDHGGHVEVEIWFYSPVGDRLPPTISAPIRTIIPSRGHYTFYSLDSSSMIPNTTGTAVVRVIGGTGRVYGVSNLVNYAVEGDGSVAFNLVNAHGQYRFPVSQTELP